MIKALDLARLALEGNLDNEDYTIITVGPKASFEETLKDIISENYVCSSAQLCVGTLPHFGVAGYLVKKMVQPELNPFLGVADAIYEMRTDEYDRTTLYVVWAIN